jgi:hypothetical protein
MNQYRFFANFNNGKSTDWIYTEDEIDEPIVVLHNIKKYPYLTDKNGEVFFINWQNIDFVKIERVK